MYAMMSEEQVVKFSLLQEHFGSLRAVLDRFSPLRELDPRFPDVPIGDLVDALYAKVEDHED